MAYASSHGRDTGAARAGSTLAAVQGYVAGVAAMLRRRKIYRATRDQLNALSSRELADLGISRSMITRLALEAARDTK